jgi:metallo-beta-lactamase class B
MTNTVFPTALRTGAACMALLGALAFATAAPAASRASRNCPECERWNEPVAPFNIFGNTWYVGTKGLSAVLVTSDFGHVLIDAALPESAPQIAANIEALGFKITDVKAILNSHVHGDHAGGIAELQRLSGAQVYARRPANDVLTSGKLTRDDPQATARMPPLSPVKTVWVVHDEQLLGVGSIRLRAIATPGHTPGGTSWTWESCNENKRDQCLTMVYADSLNPVSAGKFRFSDGGESGAGAQLARSIERIASLKCDVLITPHPEASNLFERVAQRPADNPMALKDEEGCKRYAEAARGRLDKRLEQER